MIKSTTMPIILLNPVPTNSGLHDLGSSWPIPWEREWHRGGGGTGRWPQATLVDLESSNPNPVAYSSEQNKMLSRVGDASKNP
jgi:hypothetical protein